MPSLVKRLPMLLAALFSMLGTGQAFALDHLTVQMAFYPQGPQAYLFLAEEKGWFKDAGLDVEILNGRGSGFSIQVLSSGHADIGEGQLAPLVFAREHGADIKAIAEWYRTDGLSIIAPNDSGIKTPADLKGKRVGILAAGPWPPMLSNFLSQFHLTQDDLSLVYINAASLFTTYASKDIDALMSIDLAYTEANPVRPSINIQANDYGVKMPGDGLFARTEDLQGDKGKAIARFLQVCQRAMAYIYDGHQEEGAAAIRHLQPDSKLGVEELKEQVDFFEGFRDSASSKGKPPGFQTETDWQERVDYMKKTGMLKSSPSPDDFYTNALLSDSAK